VSIARVRPIPDASSALDGRSTTALLTLALSTVQSWQETDPTGDQHLQLSCRDGVWLAHLTSALKGSRDYSVRVTCTGATPREALRKALRELLEDEDDERPTLLNEFEQGEVARC
jgi:hypothetical protein